jgi:hypothetical protein
MDDDYLESLVASYNTVIKTCLHCGMTKQMNIRYMTCPECNGTPLFFFKDLNHLIKFINNNGLMNLNIVDQSIRNAVLVAFA